MAYMNISASIGSCLACVIPIPWGRPRGCSWCPRACLELPRFSGQVRACVLGNTQMTRFILDRRHHVQGGVSPA